METSNNDINGISVIICTYNGAKRLPETLNHLALQQVPAEIKWEIILVDNNSNDGTAGTAKLEWQKNNCAIRFTVLQQPESGKTFALNMGVAASLYNVIIVCDDDNWLQKNYVSLAYEIMSTNKKIGIAGGNSVGFFEVPKPSWFDTFQLAYVVGKPFPHSGNANARNYLTGAGMVFRKIIYQVQDKYDYNFLLSCRKGNDLSSGGDSELCIMALYLGYDLYYDERLQFTHFIPAKRLNWKYCVELISKGFAISQIYFYMYDYCHENIMQDKEVSFEYAYRRNIKRPLREIKNSFAGVKLFFHSLGLLLFSHPGSEEQISLKTKFNKLKYALANKSTLRKEFAQICGLMYKLKQKND